MEKIVSRSTHQTENELSLILMIGFRWLPLENAFAKHLLLWWRIKVVLNGVGHFPRRWSLKDALNLRRERSPIGRWIPSLRNEETHRFETVLTACELPKEFERKFVQ